jgi:hypothetical protein
LRIGLVPARADQGHAALQFGDQGVVEHV